jgi:hypothetical protein
MALIMEDIITVVLTVNYKPQYNFAIILPSLFVSTFGIYHRVLGLENLIQGKFIVPLVINLVKALIYIIVAILTWYSVLNLKLEQNF